MSDDFDIYQVLDLREVDTKHTLEVIEKLKLHRDHAFKELAAAGVILTTDCVELDREWENTIASSIEDVDEVKPLWARYVRATIINRINGELKQKLTYPQQTLVTAIIDAIEPISTSRNHYIVEGGNGKASTSESSVVVEYLNQMEGNGKNDQR